MTAARRARHQRLSAFLASCSDIELAALVDTGRTNTVGVGGGSVVLDVHGVPVFAKRIPLTDRELAHPGSTTNLFDLPVWPARRSLSRCSTTGGSYPAARR